MDLATAQYFTLLYGVMDVRRFDFRFVAAGHPLPVLARLGAPPSLVTGGSLPIGIVDSAIFEETHLDLSPGDRLFFYSDGVTEARAPAGCEFGVETLLARVADTRGLPLQAAVDAIIAAVEAHCGDSGVQDDVSLLAAEIVPPA
jgi:sigma-B regulation protein RsbU (phosphoserine phosphatase)